MGLGRQRQQASGGRAGVLGRLVGRVRVLGRREKRGVGLAGWRGPSRPSLRGLLLPFFFFCFIFLLLYLNSILIFKFGFQIGAPNSLEF